MKKVAPIATRKSDHLRINLEQDVRSGLTNGLEKIHFVHEALPEVDLEAVDCSLTIFGKNLTSPILISSMTGGTKQAEIINQRLAEAAQESKIAMGVGSQRAALLDPVLIPTYTIIRDVAPDILLFANLGAIQLNNGYSIDECRRVVDMINADGLILHLNPLQEAVQAGGETNFSRLAIKIEEICNKLEKPVIVKEVGWGISERTAKILTNCGVAGIDVAGAGGTSWSQVEKYRAEDDFNRQLAAAFIGWGITTVDSIRNVKTVSPNMLVFASGGLKDGVDIAKCIALGASIGGLASQFLKTAVISSSKVVETIELYSKQIKITMFSTGSITLSMLAHGKLQT
jgi:isopentenyl-diphosphate delta-isomerase